MRRLWIVCMFALLAGLVPVGIILAAPYPDPPTGLEVITVSGQVVGLFWTNTEAPFTYTVYRNSVLIGTVKTNAYFDQFGLTPGATYTYTVRRALPGYDESPESLPVVVTIPAATATPILPIETPTPIPTPTRTPVPTSTPFAVVADPNFTRNDESAWERTGDVSWSFARMTLGPGASISQRVAYISAYEEFSVTLRASSATSGTIYIQVGSHSEQFAVTRRVAQTFAFPVIVQFPADVIISNPGTSDVIVSYIAMRRVMAGVQDVGIPGFDEPSLSAPLAVGDFFDYFVPWNRNRDTGINAGAFPVTLGGLGSFIGKTMASVIEIAYVRMFQIYLGVRMLTIGIAFVMNFVTSRLKLHDPGVDEGTSISVDVPESRYEARAHTRQRVSDFIAQRGRVRVRGYYRNPPRW